MTASISVMPLPEAPARTALTPVDLAHRRLDRLGVTAGHDVGRVGGAGRERLRRAARRPRSPRASARNWSASSSPVWIWVMPPAMTPRAITVTVTKPAGALGHGVADPAPERLAVGQAGLADVRHLGPEDPAAEDDQGGREHDEGEGGRDDDADGAGEAEAAGRGEEREQQGEQAEHDGGRAGEHGLGGTAQGDGHRLAPVLGDPQLVAVAADEQQGVVGAGTEDQHRQDADRRLVPEHAEGRQGVGGEHGGQLVGDRRRR